VAGVNGEFADRCYLSIWPCLVYAVIYHCSLHLYYRCGHSRSQFAFKSKRIVDFMARSNV